MRARDWSSFCLDLVIACFQASLASGNLKVSRALAIHSLHDNFVLLTSRAQVGNHDGLVIECAIVCIPHESLGPFFDATHLWLELQVSMDFRCARHRVSCLKIRTLLRSCSVIEVDGDYLLAYTHLGLAFILNLLQCESTCLGKCPTCTKPSLLPFLGIENFLKFELGTKDPVLGHSFES